MYKFSKALLLVLSLATLAILVACGGGATEEAEPAEEAAGETEEPAAAASRSTAEATINDATIRIDYGRPELVEGKIKDQGTTPREAREQASPGYVWRLGMDEATTLSTDKPLTFGETTVPSGEYTIFAKKAAAGSWNLVFNSQLGQWGAFSYDASRDVAAVPLTVSELEEPVEQLEMAVNSTGDNSGEIVFRWGQDEMRSTFTVQ